MTVPETKHQDVVRAAVSRLLGAPVATRTRRQEAEHTRNAVRGTVGLGRQARAGKPMKSLCTRPLGDYADRVFLGTDSLALWVLPPVRVARGPVRRRVI